MLAKMLIYLKLQVPHTLNISILHNILSLELPQTVYYVI